MKNKDPLLAYIVADPESVFDYSPLNYKSSEIESIIERFELASFKPINKYIIALLTATSDFRHSTVPEGIFKDLRSSTKTDDELKQIFIKMSAVLEQSLNFKNQLKLNEQDEKIFQTVIDYCKKSIKERMAALQPDDRLLPFWNESQLKKELER